MDVRRWPSWELTCWIGAVRHVARVAAKTVESYRTRIMKKLDTPNTAGIVRYAIRQGLIQV
jgi:hypothetical protein